MTSRTAETSTSPDRVGLTCVNARVGDRNDRAMRAARLVSSALAERLGVEPVVVGQPETPLAAAWDVELDAALPTLRALAARHDEVHAAGQVPVTALSRCAAALATLPVMARHHPDAVVLWFDAHGDLNVPEETTTGYLGGLALSGAAGMWDSGLGGDLELANVVHVGGRDLDPFEQQLIDDGVVAAVPVGPGFVERLREAVAGRPVYVHVDCDVLEPGEVPTEYLVPGGLTLAGLHAAAVMLAEHRVVGLEVGEIEAGPDDTAQDARVGELLDALEPLITAAAGRAD